MRLGDSVSLLNNAKIAITSLVYLDTTVKVYTFEVAYYHTYFVGKCGVAVHNNDCEIPKSVTSNFKRFKDKIPANSKENATIVSLGDGGYKFSAKSDAENIKGSFAMYEKWVDKNGKTTQYYKTTFAPDGSIVHIKDKISGVTILDNTKK